MGMGEPLLNLRAVTAAARFINQDLGIGARHITVSTVGVPNAIGMLASHLKEHSLQLTLAVSIHAPSQAVRQRIIPRLAFGSTFLHFTSAMTQMLRGGGHRNELHVLHDLEPQPWQIAFE